MAILVQRFVQDGKRYINITLHEEFAQKLAELMNQAATAVGKDNPFSDAGILVKFRDAIHHARWGAAVTIHTNGS